MSVPQPIMYEQQAISVPQPVMYEQQVMSMPQPVMTTAQDVTAPQAVYTTAQPTVAYAAPQTTIATPMTPYSVGGVVAPVMTYAAAPGTTDAFDTVDRNHDGVISRSEFNQII